MRMCISASSDVHVLLAHAYMPISTHARGLAWYQSHLASNIHRPCTIHSNSWRLLSQRMRHFVVPGAPCLVGRLGVCPPAQDGSSVFRFASGQVERRWPNGAKDRRLALAGRDLRSRGAHHKSYGVWPR